MKKIRIVILSLITAMSILSLAGCGEGTSVTNDYKPGNPQYDYDAWKYGQDHPGFYDD